MVSFYPGQHFMPHYNPHQCDGWTKFLENALSSAMILHRINFINDVIQHVNPSQTPVITMDQPLFALYKLIQWNLPVSHDEHKYVVTFGGLQVDGSTPL